MPYTFAHIGFVLPFKKKWPVQLSMTGLIFGSITPDYDFLFRLTNISDHLFQYDLACIVFIIYPLALLSAISFHLICMNVIIDNLPAYFQQTIQRRDNKAYPLYLKNNFIRLSYSIFLGIFMHLFLDFFGHIENPYTFKLYILNKTNNMAMGQIAFLLGCYALPILFSISGFYLLYVYLLNKKLSMKMVELNKQQWYFWFSIAIATTLIAILKFLYTDSGKLYIFDTVAIITTASLIVAMYSVCLVYKIVK